MTVPFGRSFRTVPFLLAVPFGRYLSFWPVPFGPFHCLWGSFFRYPVWVGYTPSSSSALRPLGAAYVPILLSEVEQEQRPSRNGDREAIVVGAGLCDGEGERACTVYDPILGEQKFLIFFKRIAGAKTGYGTICRKTSPKPNLPNVKDNLLKIIRQIIPESIFGKLSLSQFSANCPEVNFRLIVSYRM